MSTNMAGTNQTHLERVLRNHSEISSPLILPQGLVEAAQMDRYPHHMMDGNERRTDSCIICLRAEQEIEYCPGAPANWPALLQRYELNQRQMRQTASGPVKDLPEAISSPS